MIGKSLRERYALGALPEDVAVALVREMLTTHAAPIVEVRAADARMIACLVVHANEATVRACRALGFEVKPGGTGVFGLLGADAARLFGELSARQRAWLEVPCAPRETKVVLLAAGTATMSIEATDGKVVVTHVPG